MEQSFDVAFNTLRRSPGLQAERARVAGDFDRPPDKTLLLVAEMPEMNRDSSPETMRWKLIDRKTGAESGDIHWTFGVGERVKIRIVNEPHSDHPMQHPIHVHGQRFLVLSRDGVRNENLVWKDTELLRTVQTTDIVLDASNPGRWMFHCHIAEYLEGGMMFSFEVEGRGR